MAGQIGSSGISHNVSLLRTEEHIAAAVEYVVNGQGGELPTFD
ncbi:MAG: hypothetical protein ACK4S4_01435 [Pyrinomonadaceae bacterium]